MFGKLFRGGHGMLLRSIQGTEWSEFVDYVSPSFLEVMPVSHLLSQGREMVANAADGERFRRTRANVQRCLHESGIEVTLVRAPAETGTIADLDADARRALGQRALEVYFAQILAGESAILDLRGSRFAAAPDGAGFVWSPRPFYLRWEPDFLAGVRDLYTGFYREDDARFARGLAALSLESAGDVLQGHFGGGDQRSVRFSSRVFHSSFHEAFVRCRDAGTSLHRNFLALGLYLACLYDVLEGLDLEFDVRDAFERAAATTGSGG